MSRPPYPAAVMWAMDGTLLDTERLWDEPLYAEATRLGATLTPDGRSQLVGASKDATAEYLLRLAGLPPKPEHITNVTNSLRRRVLAEFHEPLPWRPGARDALATIRASGIRCALVTSADRVIVEPALTTLGKSNFDVIVCGDEVGGHVKPHPYPYSIAAHLLRVNPADCVAIEDSTIGSDAAVGAGYAVIVVPDRAPVPRSPYKWERRTLAGLDVDTLSDALSHHYILMSATTAQMVPVQAHRHRDQGQASAFRPPANGPRHAREETATDGSRPRYVPSSPPARALATSGGSWFASGPIWPTREDTR